MSGRWSPLRECLATNEFMNAPSKLTFALGKDVSGEFKYADLTRCRTCWSVAVPTAAKASV